VSKDKLESFKVTGSFKPHGSDSFTSLGEIDPASVGGFSGPLILTGVELAERMDELGAHGPAEAFRSFDRENPGKLFKVTAEPMTFERAKEERRIYDVINWSNGMTMVFDQHGEQMTEYQGRTEEVMPKIRAAGFEHAARSLDWKRNVLGDLS
jgi:hypothetical protein